VGQRSGVQISGGGLIASYKRDDEVPGRGADRGG
jgi:hypothetical protein